MDTTFLVCSIMLCGRVMILYHGSIKEIPNPSIIIGRDKLDFGRGFYTTELFEQAKLWACKPFEEALLEGN